MELIKRDTSSLQTQQQHSPVSFVTIRELSTEHRTKWIERVFARLLAIYGERFTAMWSHSSADEMKEVWADALGGFNAATLSLAIKACYDEKYPPNLPEFVAICRRYYQRPQTFAEYRKEVADQSMAELIETTGRKLVSK